jgi:hypothetical protein
MPCLSAVGISGIHAGEDVKHPSTAAQAGVLDGTAKEVPWETQCLLERASQKTYGTTIVGIYRRKNKCLSSGRADSHLPWGVPARWRASWKMWGATGIRTRLFRRRACSDRNIFDWRLLCRSRVRDLVRINKHPIRIRPANARRTRTHDGSIDLPHAKLSARKKRPGTARRRPRVCAS